jgi:hypothetical protein
MHALQTSALKSVNAPLIADTLDFELTAVDAAGSRNPEKTAA